MSQLFYMEYKNKKMEEVKVQIIDEVKPRWPQFVHALELPARTIANEMAKPGWTPDTACSNVFIAWLSGEGAKPHTWATVFKALKKIGDCKELIKQVKLALNAESCSK